MLLSFATNHEFFYPLTPTLIDCEEVMNLLDECHARGFLHSALGNCNEAKRDVTKCLRAARIERQKMNLDKAREKRKETLEMWKEIDDNS